MNDARTAGCDACLRRTQLVALLAGRIEHERRRGRLPEILGLSDEGLLRAVAGREAEAVRRRIARFDAAAARRACEGAGLVAVCRHDTRYPSRLLDAPDAPAVLHVAGDAQVLATLGEPMEAAPAVAIVGARRATGYGVEVARGLGRGVAAAGVTVVSGMAFGVDAAAQAGALEAGGPTIAVLAGGADVPYPAGKRRLYERIVGHPGLLAGQRPPADDASPTAGAAAASATGKVAGCVVSEMPPGFEPFRWSFPARNRIIAALGGLTVVVEAAERSGSLITAELAAGLGRGVAAVPGQVTAPQAAGTNALLADGAALVRDARDVLDHLLGPGAFEASATATPRGGLEPRLCAVARGRGLRTRHTGPAGRGPSRGWRVGRAGAPRGPRAHRARAPRPSAPRPGRALRGGSGSAMRARP